MILHHYGGTDKKIVSEEHGSLRSLLSLECVDSRGLAATSRNPESTFVYCTAVDRN